MSINSKLSHIDVFKLHETYDTLYDLQQRLGISNDYLSSTGRNTNRDEKLEQSLLKLLEASKQTRDNLITCYLKQSLVELNVTISLLTAKIKFIEYKLGRCEGIDLHRSCSLSLVDFCNILADLTVLNVRPVERKTMHKISREADVPVWLSHYRNQICHVPSEGPCIAILAPLVVKSLAYMRETFWSKLLEKESFDERRCKNLIFIISKFTNLISINHHLEVKRGIEVTKKQAKNIEDDIVRCNKAQKALRRMLFYNSVQSVEVLVKLIVSWHPRDNKNFALLIEQVILSRSFERFVFCILREAEKNPRDSNIISWLRRVIFIVGSTDRRELKRIFKKMDICVSMKTVRLTNIAPLNCCQISHRLVMLDNPSSGAMIFRLRHRLIPVLGKERTSLLLKLTKIAKSSRRSISQKFVK